MCNSWFRWACCAKLLGISLAVSPLAGRAGDAPAIGNKQQALQLVQQALQLRATGNSPRIAGLVDEALRLDPECGPAHWQRGEMRHQGSWMPVRDIQQRFAESVALHEYEAQRQQYAQKSKLIWLTSPPGQPAPLTAPAYLRAPDGAPRYLRYEFELDAPANWAEMHFQAAGVVTVTLNGNVVIDSKQRRGRVRETITKYLRAGKNVLAMSVAAHPAALAPGVRCWIEGTHFDRSIFTIASGSAWKVTAESVGDWNSRECDLSNWDDAIGADVQFADEEDEAQATIAEISPPLEESLARWCDKHKLVEQARFHWTRLLVYQPQNQEAMIALDLVRFGDKLLTKEQAAQERKAAREASVSNKHWLTVFTRARQDLDDPSPKRVESAAASVRKADLASIPAFETILASREAAAGTLVPFAREYIIGVLAQSQEPEATQALVRLAMAGPVSVRDMVVEQLQRRDLMAFVPPLIAMLVGPVEVATQVDHERDGSAVCKVVYSQRKIFEDESRKEAYRFQLVRGNGAPSSAVTAAFLQARSDANERATAKKVEIETAVASSNKMQLETNRQIFQLLRSVTQQELPDELEPWWTWWKDYNELMHPLKNPVRVTSYFNTQYLRYDEVVRRREKDCFVAGTLVWTASGLRPIETIMPGDAVLAQHQETGELAHKVVLGVSVRPPHELLALTAGGETIVGTRGHRYWKRGSSWTMAKNLNPGDALHTVNGEALVSRTGAAEPQPTYNLIVDEFNSYFVGRAGILVHDNGIPTPTTAELPGLRR